MRPPVHLNFTKRMESKGENSSLWDSIVLQFCLIQYAISRVVPDLGGGAGGAFALGDIGLGGKLKLWKNEKIMRFCYDLFRQMHGKFSSNNRVWVRSLNQCKLRIYLSVISYRHNNIILNPNRRTSKEISNNSFYFLGVSWAWYHEYCRIFTLSEDWWLVSSRCFEFC